MTCMQIAYYSRNTVKGDGRSMLSTLRQVLNTSRTNNQRDHLTGFLLFDARWFVQILEGETEQVWTTYRRIELDRRHADLVILAKRDVKTRSFPEWSMGGTMRTPENEEVFLRHGIGNELDPTRLTAPSIIALAMDLQDARRASRTAAW